jgi:glycosyltransferase involved in cell wall biosynthesis
MNASPKVSVIIPAYNGDRFIAEAIDSVLNQTYQNVETIVVDDGSTDNTYKALNPYLKWIHYTYQDNQGVATARNQGLQIASGEYIAFLDQDDVFLPNKLANQITYFNDHPQVSIVHSGWQRINQVGEILGQVEPWYKASRLDLEAWIWWKPVLLSAMMFQRDCLIEVGGLDPRFKQACDVDLALRLTLMGYRTDWLRQITVCYREHDQNDSLNTPIQAKESETVLDKFFSLHQVPNAILESEDRFRYYTLVWSAWRLYLTGHVIEMTQYLEKSLNYTPFSRTETILNWVENFDNYFAERNCPFNAFSLSNLEEWKNLINFILSH